MSKLMFFAALAALLCSSVLLIGSAQDNSGQLVIEVTKQQSRPLRGAGPFPGSHTLGHSAGLPIRLELLMPNRGLRPNGTTTVDFIITNVGTEPIKLPSSVVLLDPPMEALTLWLTSDGVQDFYFPGGSKIEAIQTSAELDGQSDDQKSFFALAPNKSVRVHATSPLLIAGTHSFTAHAEFARITGTTEVIGTADSNAVTTSLSMPNPTSR
jgi:hypothetical protein